MAIATLPELKAHLGIPLADVSQDAKLTAILAGVETWITETAAANGRAVAKETARVDLLDGTGSARLFLPRRPVIAVTTIKVDGNARPTWDASTLVAASGYRVYLDTGIVKRLSDAEWTEGLQNVQVTYDVGYAAIPANLKLGVLTMAAYFAGEGGGKGLKSETLGKYSYTMQDVEQVPGLLLLLAPYLGFPVAL
jgi:hypothetical protein